MACVLGVLAALLWGVGMVLLVLALLSSTAIDSFPDICQCDDPECFDSPGGPNVGAVVGTVLVGVAGVLAAGLVLAARRRPS